ncbi:hypothetical protein [Bacteroides sp. 224]|uniref:hypothetical protein n=1 Tax=Bacteroides sp. 224 TaxID=2302936 RepID=UPI0013CF5A9E|nr:hypothetical protein [Bacteroides sp. 224]NDV64019.1 hypothetical protein [Bacteroides sp. 224]
MGNKNIQAYCYYKEQYPNTVVLFRVGNNYEVYQEDAESVAKIIGLDIEKTEVSNSTFCKITFPVDKGLDFVSTLASHNVITKMVSQRNENGEFDIPDINQLKTDKENDY